MMNSSHTINGVSVLFAIFSIKTAFDENKNLESKLKEYIKADLEHDAQNRNWEKVFKPIRGIDTTKDAGSLPMDCLIAIQESQRLYNELFDY